MIVLTQGDEKREIQARFDDLNRQTQDLQINIKNSTSQLQASQDQILALERQISTQQDLFQKEKLSLQESLESTLESRLREEKLKWEEDQTQGTYTPPPTSYFVTSPVGSSARPVLRPLKSPLPQDVSRARPSARTNSYTDLRRPSRLFSPSTLEAPPPTPLEDDDEREFLGQPTTESPKNTVVSVSASTGTGGPSVNIVERMSAAVRRLEGQVTGMREELSRMGRQRDEAREECVRLMEEVETKRRVEEMVKEVQRKYQDLEIRCILRQVRLIC
jgi:TATA element modulatory factor